jgi:hypothetical protein
MNTTRKIIAVLEALFVRRIILAGIDAAPRSQPLSQAALLLAGCLLLAGAVVGGIHGAFLVALTGSADPRTRAT